MEYPKTPDVNIVKARVSQASSTLKIERDLLINSKDGEIKVNNMGVLNEGEFFMVDVYILDIPQFVSLTDYLEDWDLVAKAVDLRIRKNIIPDLSPKEEGGFLNGFGIRVLIFSLVFSLVFSAVAMWRGFAVSRREPQEMPKGTYLTWEELNKKLEEAKLKRKSKKR